MDIFFSSDNATDLDADFAAGVEDRLKERLDARFGDRITRVEAHVRDVDGTTNGPQGIEATLEARQASGGPVVVTERAGEPMQAVNAALGTLVNRLDSAFGKADRHRV